MILGPLDRGIAPLGRARGSNPYLDSLVAYWKLDEASGTRFDSHGTNHLADINTVAQAAGRVGNAALFTPANNEALRAPDSASLSMGSNTAFTVALWVYFNVNPGASDLRALFSKDDGAGQREYYAYHTANQLLFAVFTPAGVHTPLVKITALSIGTWYFVCCWYDRASLNSQINGGAISTVAFTAGVKDGTSAFELGRAQQLSTRILDGRLDECGIWKRALSAAERSHLYDSGAGRTYPLAA
jgi:Concanavalin A-like lectin/glucanases superfamily